MADGLRFITGIKFAKSAMQALNRVTFIYNPNWSSVGQTESTFPVAFFNVRAMHEIHEAQVSQKQMLFYNAQKTVSNNSVSSGLLNVVADNIVVKPKIYRLDVIVPYADLTMLDRNPMMNTETLSACLSLITNGEKQGTTAANVSAILSVGTTYMQILTSVLKTLVATDFSSVKNMITSVLSTPEYNKNSLEAMFYSRSILKMKTWNSWKYKYVALTNMDITKEADEEGVYEASLTCTEVPIMTIRSTAGLKFGGFTNPVAELAGKAASKLLDLQEGK